MGESKSSGPHGGRARGWQAHGATVCHSLGKGCVAKNAAVPADDEQAVRVPKTGEQEKRRVQAG